MTIKKSTILFTSLMFLYVCVAVVSFIFATLPEETIFDKGFIVGFLLALSSAPYLLIFWVKDGFNNERKAVYGAFGIIGIALGVTSLFLEQKNVDVLNTICMIRGIFDIVRLTVVLTDIIPSISIDKNKVEIIDLLVSVGEAIVAVFLIIDGIEGVQVHFFYMGIAAIILLGKCVLEIILKFKKTKNEKSSDSN